MDARRISDGRIVFLKSAPKNTPEVEIGRLLSSDSLKADPRNHSLPLLDVVEDDTGPDEVILVLPLVRRLDDPVFVSIREMVDFVDQTLQVSLSYEDPLV